MREVLAKDTFDWQERQKEIATVNAEMDAKKIFLEDKEKSLKDKTALYLANNAALVKEKADFEDEKQRIQDLAAKTASMNDDINKKIDIHKSLVIENSRIQVDIARKSEDLKEDLSKNLQSINELTNLKTKLTEIGAKDATKTA